MVTPECHVRDKGFHLLKNLSSLALDPSILTAYLLLSTLFTLPILSLLPFSVSLPICQSFFFCLLTMLSYKYRPHLYSNLWPNTHSFSHIYFHQLFCLSCILTVFLMTPVFPKNMFLYSVRIFLLPLFFLWTLILSHHQSSWKDSHVHCFYLHVIHILILKWNKGSLWGSSPKGVSLFSLSSLTFILHMRVQSSQFSWNRFPAFAFCDIPLLSYIHLNLILKSVWHNFYMF